MTSETDDFEDKYPHWLDAIRNHSAVINVYCGAKYLLWHLSHLLLTIVGLAVILVVKAFQTGGKYFPSDTVGDAFFWVADKFDALDEKLESSGAKAKARTAINWGVTAVAVASGILMVVTVILIAWNDPKVFLAALGGVIVLILGALGGIWLIEEKKVVDRFASVASSAGNKAGSTAKKTPGVKRVYGKCPVDMDTEPKWFRKIRSMTE